MGYYSTLSALSPYGWWKLHETSGTTIYNTAAATNDSINNTTGVTRNSTAPSQYTESGNYAYAFNNTNTCWVGLNTTTYGTDMENNNACTWTVIGALDNASGLINVARQNADSTGYRYAVYVSGGTYWIYFFVRSYFDTETNVNTGVSYVAGAYHHFAVTYSNNSIRCYIDGTDIGGRTLSNYTWASTAGGKVNLFSSFDGSYDHSRQSKIDDIACWRSTLSASNITSLASSAGFAALSATVNATVTDIDVIGKNQTISISDTDTTTTTNISLDAKDATVTAIQNVQVENSPNNINITGVTPVVSSQTGIIIPITTSNIALDAKNANVSISTSINVTTTNLDITAYDVLPLYTAIITEHDPVHFYRFTPVETYHLKDYGRIPLNGTLYNLSHPDDATTGIPGDDESYAVLLNGSAGTFAEAFTFFGNNLFNTNGLLNQNGSIEFWFRTESLFTAMLAADGTDSTTGRNTIFIGTYNGYLSLVRLGAAATDVRYITNSNVYVADGNWHHVVLTKQYNSSTNTYTYKSFVDAQQTPNILSLGTFLSFADLWSNRHSIGTYADDTGINNEFTFSLIMDEIAIYDITLSNDDIQDHYYVGIGILNASISAPVTNISIDETSTRKDLSVSVSKSNISVKSQGFIVNPGSGSFILTATKTNIATIGKTPTISKVGYLTINQQSSNISVNNTITRFRTADLLFKFISAQDTGLSAEDAETLESLDYGGMLYNQVKKLLFRIGNLEDNPISYQITTTTKETAILPAITLSNDNITFSNSITIQNVAPNSISDIIYVKFDVNYIDTLGPGTFLINVEQINE